MVVVAAACPLPCSPQPPLCGRVLLRRWHGDEQSHPNWHPRLCRAVQPGKAHKFERRRWALSATSLRPTAPPSINLAAWSLLALQHYNDCKLLAIADEEGYVSVVDTSCQLPTEMADDWGPSKPRAQWAAHRNAVFDLAWCNVSAVQ